MMLHNGPLAVMVSQRVLDTAADTTGLAVLVKTITDTRLAAALFGSPFTSPRRTQMQKRRAIHSFETDYENQFTRLFTAPSLK